MEDNRNIFNEKFTVEMTGGEMVLVIDCMKNMMIDVERFCGDSKTKNDFARMGANIALKFKQAIEEGEQNV